LFIPFPVGDNTVWICERL